MPPQAGLDLRDVINNYALSVGGVFVVRANTWIFYTRIVENQRSGLDVTIEPIPYFTLDGTTLKVVNGKNLTEKTFDIAQPDCFEQIEEFLGDVL